MGRVAEILTFPVNTDKREIIYECDEWARANADYRESGGRGLPSPVQFTQNKTFDSYDEAAKYLEGTYGRYREIAVMYKQWPEPKKTMALETLEKRIREAYVSIREIEDKPHYKGTKQSSVTCKKCGSRISTEYCGWTYTNFCPVCKSDLRPASVLEQISKKKEAYAALKAKYADEKKKAQKKASAKPDIFWAVACEVHN